MYFDGGLAEHMDTQHVEIDGSWLGRKMFVIKYVSATYPMFLTYL